MSKKEKTTAPEQSEQTETEPETAAETEEVQAPTAEEKLQAELDAQKESLLRLAAEYDNYRKRTTREKEELNSVCKCAVVTDILPVIDNLDRALSNQTDNLEEYKKGVEMIGKQFYETLKKLGVEDFGAVGDAFDPNLHNAVMHIEDENLGENVIAAVFNKGYKLGEKVIRPAMVQVAN
ncbi:MAG: nucleotide exchange factor GrpE [Oscillospiraceae bacterium]|nr:nucleotide exchange factor GrpE [Oscillospiraceae bacterium]